EVVDQLGLSDLSAQDDHAVLGVDVDLALGHVRVAEDLALDLVGEGGVVGLGLLLLVEMLRLLRGPVGLGRDGSTGPPEAPRERPQSVSSEAAGSGSAARLADRSAGMDSSPSIVSSILACSSVLNSGWFTNGSSDL